MKAVLQRVKNAKVEVDCEVIGEISCGFLIFLGVEETDQDEDLGYLIKKISKLRVFNDQNGKMNLDLTQTKGSILLVSQFTLLADTRKGNRPSFHLAANPQKGEHFYEKAIQALKDLGFCVKTGKFGAEMQVFLVNDGPVTILFDSADRHRPRSSD